MLPIALINRDKSIWGEDAKEFKLVLFLISFLFGYPTWFYFLDLSVGRIFRMLPLLFLESGQACWHSLGDLELASVFDFHLWSESFFHIHQHRFQTLFLNLLCLCIRTKALLFTLIRAFEIDLAVSPKDIGLKHTGIRRPILLTDPNDSNQMPLLVRPVSSNF